MKKMGLEAIYRRPNTSKPAPGHKIYPYLLRKVKVEKPNQVWAMDITYVPMAKRFVYLAAVVAWFSRRVLSWRLSITMGEERAPLQLECRYERLLHRSCLRGIAEIWQARNLQHGPGQPVHVCAR